MRTQEMNHVNLIGQMSSVPQVVLLEGGRKKINFFLSTRETYLDEKGETKANKNWHRITAWGKWATVLEELGSKGQSLAIEGKLRSRYFSKNGMRQSYSEIEINDMVIL